MAKDLATYAGRISVKSLARPIGEPPITKPPTNKRVEEIIKAALSDEGIEATVYMTRQDK